MSSWWNRTAPLPSSGCSSPAMMRSSVVLPEPLGPSSATSSPVPIVRLTFFSAWKLPKVLLTLLTSMLMGGGEASEGKEGYHIPFLPGDKEFAAPVHLRGDGNTQAVWKTWANQVSCLTG